MQGGYLKSLVQMPTAARFIASRLAPQGLLFLKNPVWSFRSQHSSAGGGADENANAESRAPFAESGEQARSSPTSWWIDNKGKDYRLIGKEDWSRFRNPEIAEALSVFNSQPGLSVNCEDLGLDQASRRLSKMVAQEGIIDKFRSQRVGHAVC
jgi:hypothetical protein